MLWLLGSLAVGAPLATLVSWNRLTGPRAVRAALRLGLVGVSQLFAVLLVAGLLNDQYAFFVSWHDLIGAAAPVGPIVETRGTALAGPGPPVTVYPAMVERSTRGGGRAIEEMVHGGASGVSAPVTVLLPPEYFRPGWRSRRFPVVEFLPGWPGSPHSWLTAMHLVSAMGKEGAHRTRPFIAVLPTTYITLPKDTECTDVPGGSRAETWLTTDVRDLVLRQFRAESAGASWGLVGYSTGAYSRRSSSCTALSGTTPASRWTGITTR